jgi:MSHA biogenesis protein MshE
MLEMTNEIAAAASLSDPAQFVRIAQAQMAGNTLRRHAVALVTTGKTTVGEAMRVTSQLED